MINIQHEDGKYLVINNNGQASLLAGQEGNVTSTPDGVTYEWYDTREEAVTAVKVINPDWVDPEEELRNLPE